MKVHIVDSSATVNVASQDDAGAAVHVSQGSAPSVVAMQGTPGTQGPPGPPGEGDRLRSGPLNERPTPEHDGAVWVATDTGEFYIATNMEE